jgi:hypothetical protein
LVNVVWFILMRLSLLPFYMLCDLRTNAKMKLIIKRDILPILGMWFLYKLFICPSIACLSLFISEFLLFFVDRIYNSFVRLIYTLDRLRLDSIIPRRLEIKGFRERNTGIIYNI